MTLSNRLSHQRILPWALVLSCLAVFGFDCATPRGLAAGIVYIPLVFCSLWFTRPHAPFVFATLTTALTIIGIFLSPPGHTELWIVVLNRVLTIAALWFVALLAYMRRQSEGEREAIANKLSAVVENLLDGLVTIDEQGIIESFNPACERIFGYTSAEVVGQNLKLLMPESYHSEQDGFLHHYLSAADAKTIGPTGREAQARRKDGTVFPINLLVSSFLEGGVRHFTGIICDIKERKLAEEKAALLTAIVASSDDAIVSRTVDGMITSWNASAERLFGYTASETIGNDIRLIIPLDRIKEEDDIISRIRKGKSVELLETIRKDKAGHNVDISLTVSPILDAAGNIVGVSKILRDITERKLVEQRLELAVEKLTESNMLLERFAYVCSHDLQEPLRMISNYTQRLEKHLESGMDDKGRHYMQYIIDGANNARDLIADVLSFASIGNQMERLEPVDCGVVLKNILATLETATQESRTTITHDSLPVITGHTTQILQLFQNLITNAIKFRGSEPPQVHIGARQKDGAWEFSVSDNGIGIAPEYREKVFVIFQRLNRRGEYPGTGIGLAICKKIVDQGGGRIWLESEPGKGTTFFFTLPTSAEH